MLDFIYILNIPHFICHALWFDEIHKKIVTLLLWLQRSMREVSHVIPKHQSSA